MLVATVVPKKDMRLCIFHQAIHFAKSQQFNLKDFTLFALTGQFVWVFMIIQRAAVFTTLILESGMNIGDVCLLSITGKVCC